MKYDRESRGTQETIRNRKLTYCDSAGLKSCQLAKFLTSLTNILPVRVSPGPQDPGPDLQNILRQSYDYLTIMPKLGQTYDGRLIHKTSYNEWQGLF